MSVVTYIELKSIQIWLICMIQFWMKVNMFLSHLMLCTIYFWMILSVLANHPKVEVIL